MKKRLIPILLALTLLLALTIPVYAATTQDVTVTATPQYVSISNTPSTFAAGTVEVSTDYWSSGSAPTFPLDDGECHYTVTNNGAVSANITVKGTNFTGGVGWNLVATPASDNATMKAGQSGDANEGAMITLTTGEQDFIMSLAASGTKKWEIKLESPTAFTDGVEKTSTVTLTATAS